MIITVVLISYLLALGATVMDDAPNIVILLIDDLGFNDVGFHGSTQILTPTVNSLAQKGTVLTRHYVQSLCT